MEVRLCSGSLSFTICLRPPISPIVLFAIVPKTGWTLVRFTRPGNREVHYFAAGVFEDRNFLTSGRSAGYRKVLGEILLNSMLKVIIADDTKEDLVLTNRILQQCKLLNPVSLVSSAAECVEELKRLQTVAEGESSSLVLLDLIMPQESGLHVLRYLQNSDYQKHCLVVMLSGLCDVKAINEGYQLGAKTFLLKPLTARDMVELVNSLAEISIEETPEGYVLHWKERLTADSDLRRRTTRIRSLAA